MTGTIAGFQYDTVTGESIRTTYTVGSPPENVSPTDDVQRPADYAYVYNLSNNGQWYAGSTYIQYQGIDDTIVATKLGDNAAANEWWNSWVIVYNSSHQASGSSAGVQEDTLLGKDGNTYVSDINSSGTTIASAEYVTATGKYITSNNWAPGTPDEPAQMPSGAVTALEHVEFHTYDETLYGNPGAGPNPNQSLGPSAVPQKIDLTGITSSELHADLTSAAKVAPASALAAGPVLNQFGPDMHFNRPGGIPLSGDIRNLHFVPGHNVHSLSTLLHMS